jgi:biopolymer transport protein ExbD|tara:strand:+ start:7962 stop:8399 length:438 start_codon:yes stop_codon:yes gene_type:complete
LEFQRVKRNIPLVPIIPLIDILAIMLIYFAVMTESKTERSTMVIELALAQDSIVIQVVSSSSVLAIAADGTIQLDATRVHEEMLVEYLKVFREQFPDRKLELEPDKMLPLQGFIKIQKALIDAGFDPKDVPTRVKIPESSLKTEN